LWQSETSEERRKIPRKSGRKKSENSGRKNLRGERIYLGYWELSKETFAGAVVIYPMK